MIVLRSDEEIDCIRHAGTILRATLEIVRASARSGVQTKELDAIARDEILKRDGFPAFKNYKGYPGNICARSTRRSFTGYLRRAD